MSATITTTDTFIRIAVVAFNNISTFHLSIPCVVFGEALHESNPFIVDVCCAEEQPIKTSSGFFLSNLASLDSLKHADIIIVPSWRDVNELAPDALLTAIQDAHARGAYIVGLCLGVYVLAQAGLLEGRRATTHWEYIHDLEKCFPNIKIVADALYLEDDQILTSAGTAASMDACLQIIRLRLGAQRANQAARRLVIQPQREGNQTQFIKQPLPMTSGGKRLIQIIDSIRQRLDEKHTLDSLAAEAHMSRRSFTRQFKDLTGNTVVNWLLVERLNLAQQLLERRDFSVEKIAELTGFSSVETLRHHFRKTYKMTPYDWRRNFQHKVVKMPQCLK